MTSDDLTPEQLAWVNARLADLRRAVGRVHDRMAARGFPKDDPLLAAIREANEALFRAAAVSAQMRKARERAADGERPAWRAAREGE